MTRYFAHLTTLEEIKTAYRHLAKQWHPDRPGGDTATMQQINAQYHDALKALDGSASTGTDGREHTYHYNRQTEQSVMDKLAEILAIRGTFEVILIGTWLWIVGDTKPIKDQLGKNGAGCQWHRKRQCWYWRPETARHYGKSSPHGLGELAARYGADVFASRDNDAQMATA